MRASRRHPGRAAGDPQTPPCRTGLGPSRLQSSPLSSELTDSTQNASRPRFSLDDTKFAPRCPRQAYDLTLDMLVRPAGFGKRKAYGSHQFRCSTVPCSWIRGGRAGRCQSVGTPVVGRPGCATVSVRFQDSLDEISTEWEHAPLDILIAAAPWRTSRWHRGQKHYSGFPPRLIGVADCCCR